MSGIKKNEVRAGKSWSLHFWNWSMIKGRIYATLKSLYLTSTQWKLAVELVHLRITEQRLTFIL